MRAEKRPKVLLDNHSWTCAECQAARLCLGLRANRREEPGQVECWHLPPPRALRLWWACKVHPMGELLVHPADLLHAAKQVRTWHDDCAAVFADSLQVIGVATEQGWTGSSKESMNRLSAQWQGKHRALLSQVLVHSQGFSSAALEYTDTDDASSHAIELATINTSSLNL